MPTGYTAPIEDLTKPYSFEEYVWGCARAFDMWSRDNDGPLPLEHEPDIRYDLERVARLEKELAEVTTLSDEALQAKLDLEYEESLAYWEKEKVRGVAIHARHVEMRAKVEAWTPPTELHHRMKEFMLEQLNIGHFNHLYEPRRPEKRIAVDERAERILHLKEDILRTEKRVREAIVRTKEKNAWLKALNESVPRP